MIGKRADADHGDTTVPVTPASRPGTDKALRLLRYRRDLLVVVPIAIGWYAGFAVLLLFVRFQERLVPPSLFEAFGHAGPAMVVAWTCWYKQVRSRRIVAAALLISVTTFCCELLLADVPSEAAEAAALLAFGTTVAGILCVILRELCGWRIVRKTQQLRSVRLRFQIHDVLMWTAYAALVLWAGRLIRLHVYSGEPTEFYRFLLVGIALPTLPTLAFLAVAGQSKVVVQLLVGPLVAAASAAVTHGICFLLVGRFAAPVFAIVLRFLIYKWVVLVAALWWLRRCGLRFSTRGGRIDAMGTVGLAPRVCGLRNRFDSVCILHVKHNVLAKGKTMLKIRKAQQRGYADHGWLKSYHTFSFAGYRDPEHMGFRSLRVMNEDRVAAGQGFGTHAHNDMEIVSYVLEGELEHKDSMGNGEVLRPGEFQRISAGTGITHSEFNPSSTSPTHFYQIWLLPEQTGIAPSYEQKTFDPVARQNRFQLVASREGTDDSLLIHQDAKIFLADVTQGSQLNYGIPVGRHLWLQVLRGSVSVNGQPLDTGDAVSVSEESELRLLTESAAETMLFDLA